MVNARGGVFVIKPRQEVTDSVELMVSDATSVEVYGNLSVADGFVDFYVTSPSGMVLLCYNKTAFSTFKFVANENGTYVLHLANRWSQSNVTVRLHYRVHWKIIVEEKTGIGTSTENVQLITSPPLPPINIPDVISLLATIVSLLYYILKILGVKIYLYRKENVKYIREFNQPKSSS